MDIEEAKKEIQELVDMLGRRQYREDLSIIYNFIKRQQADLEKKDKVINEMSNFINLMSDELVAEIGDNNLEFCKMQKCIDNGDLDCEECIKEYFTKKVEGK